MREWHFRGQKQAPVYPHLSQEGRYEAWQEFAHDAQRLSRAKHFHAAGLCTKKAQQILEIAKKLGDEWVSLTEK